ncbi:hypothetical protein EV383_4428 [Pseudonocardia sediminis]|uniref:Uncharacterized protein n=1 Tax=Pseudonocardia sediminis TaxID=1397368 RepID=A0A4Q7V456_PSEST|nr:hypothetical protein [Pseudonocardia sediminis]RZT87503.1 hypothetical protein EV383_4428 [Pseudonocardia sediminis]
MSTSKPMLDVDTSAAERKAAEVKERLAEMAAARPRAGKSNCLDDHSVMKPVPNRADRQRMKRTKP